MAGAEEILQLNDNGMQSHCRILASNTREVPFADEIHNFLLAVCTFCSGCDATFLGDETCHSGTVIGKGLTVLYR